MPPTTKHPLLAVENDYEFIAAIINENRVLSAKENFSGWQELRKFCNFTSTMVWAFPVANMMRWKVRRNKRLRKILQFRELLPVRNNIEKGSFAYDTLLFRENIFSLLKNKSHLANLVCLAILFGDEFIDGIAVQYGKKETGFLIYYSGYNFNLQSRVNSKQQFELYYEFDICELLPQHVLESVNEKYEITYSEFYRHLLFLLSEMNRQLAVLPEDVAAESAGLICKVCNLCFATYKEDIYSFNENYSFNDLMSYQKSKDEDIVNVLLSLRAVLLSKRTLEYQKNFFSWSSMVRCMQLYDDMEDAVRDCDFQMNICCWFAKNYFIKEWNWLQQNKEQLKNVKGVQLNATIALNMPGSCILVMEYAKNLCMINLNWVQRKILNYLWKKNWLGFNLKVTKDHEFSISQLMTTSSPSASLKMHFIIQKVQQVDHALISDEMKNAWIIDVALMDKHLRKHLYKHISRSEKYSLLNHFLEWDTYKKASLIKKLNKKTLAD